MKQCTKIFSVQGLGGHFLKISTEIKGDEIVRAQVYALGCLPFLKLVRTWESTLKGPLRYLSWASKQSVSKHGISLLKEAEIKICGVAEMGEEVNLCRCRDVSEKRVKEAVGLGYRELIAIGRETGAGITCGSCRSDIMRLMSFQGDSQGEFSQKEDE